ncbi:MAG: HAD hydrolase family protein [bacterium]|nr:HAD hydrolase family protein [bacterium]
MSNYITTFTGKHFTPLAPLEKDIDIRDIAHALSLIIRAGGHYKEFYSVAQHSLHCAYEAMERRANPRLVLLCLLHDSAEAYIADVTRPVKRNMPDYKAAERRILNAIYKKYLGILPDEKEIEFIKTIDNALFYHEFLYHMNEKPFDEAPYLNSEPDFSFVPFKNIENEFINIFEALCHQLRELKKIRIIGLDLDGTLFRSDKSISPRLKSALQNAADKGIEIVPASGRSYAGIPAKVKELPGVHYLITTNGADVYTLDGQRLYSRSMPCADAADITKRIIDMDVIVGAYIDGRGYMERSQYSLAEQRGTEKFVLDYFRETRTLVDGLPEFILENNRAVQIITPTFYGTPEKVRNEITGLVRDYDNMIYVYGSPSNIDISHPEASKGFGITELARLKGIDPSYTAAFGDSENDADMLRKAGFGFAMANGDKYAYDAADFIARSNDEDGVADVIEKLIL